MCSYIRFAADIAHGGATSTRHLVTAGLLHELGLTALTRPHLRLRHLLLANIKTMHNYRLKPHCTKLFFTMRIHCLTC